VEAWRWHQGSEALDEGERENPMANPELLKNILTEIKSVEPWPTVATRVLELSSRSDVIPGELIAVIQTDAALTAKVLKLCNSAYYGFQREIASLTEAGNALGVQALVNLVLTSCASRYFSQGAGNDDHARRLWERSVMNALAANLLARIHGGVDKNRAYTAALLQNIGHLVIDHHLEDFKDQIAEARDEGLDMLAAEKKVIGLNHAQIGGRLARRWGFPEALVDSIEHHHTPELATSEPMLASIAHLAESITYALALGEGLENMAYELSESALGLTGIDHVGFLSMEDVLLKELAKARDFVEAG